MTAHNKHPGSNGLCFQAVHDCWADDVRVENCDLGFGFTTTKAAPRSITIALQGLTGEASGLPARDFQGDLENATYLLGQRPAVPDLYAAQRQLRPDGA